MTGDGAEVGSPPHRCVVAGGCGAVGRMMGEALHAHGAVVTLVDPEPPVGKPHGLTYHAGDVTVADPALAAVLAKADTVILCLPEAVALAALPTVWSLAPQALLVETLSVKSRIAEAISTGRAGLPAGPAVGLNPMFAPSLGIAGRPVLTVVHRDGPQVGALLDVLRRNGAQLVRTDADRHDRLCATSQALTHAAVLAFGYALAELDADVGQLAAVAPPPHATMLGLTARIVGGEPEVYWDVQYANPYAHLARAALAHGVERLRTVTGDRGPHATGEPTVTGELTVTGEEAFAQSLTSIGDRLGPFLPHFRRLCSDVFERVPGPDSAILE